MLDVDKVELFLPVMGSHLCLEEILNPEVKEEKHSDDDNHTKVCFNHHHEPFLFPSRLKISFELGQIKNPTINGYGLPFIYFLFIHLPNGLFQTFVSVESC